MKKISLGILILSNTWGGTENIIEIIAKNIDKEKFYVNLLVNDFLYHKYKRIRSVNVVNLGSLESNKKVKKIYSIFKIRYKLLKSIKKFKIEILQAQLENTILLLGICLNQINIPLIFALKGDETEIYHNPKTLEHLIISKFLDMNFKNKHTTIISVSRWLIKDYSKRIRNKIKVICNGVDNRKFRPLNLKRIENSILFAGRYVEKKGIRNLLKVARDLKEYNFIFAGMGPLKHLINLPNTKDLGFRQKNELVNLYNTADICVFPSKNEAFGNVCLEAMSCGACVIVTNSGFSEIVEDGKDGLIIEPDNAKELKKAILMLIQNQELKARLRENARKKALLYDIKKSVVKYQDLYMRVAAK